MSAIPPSDASPPFRADPAERRAAVRHPCDLDTFLRTLNHPELDQTWPARIRDISTTGIGLQVEKPFAVGAELEIELQSGEQGITYTLLTRVVHTGTVEDDGSYLLGCAFARPLSESELDQLL